MNAKSTLLKTALFATGFSGIVSEYVLATLASYFLGDSIVQWALVISLMLFFMGIGARITRQIEKNVFAWLVGTEFLLSIIVSMSALLTYAFAAYSDFTGLLIYSISALTGCLIGMELPLAIRLNDQFEVLQVNVSNILEKDYYGSLVGGVFFVFVGLPFFGLAYTPIALGLVNLLVGIALLNVFPAFGKWGKMGWNVLAFALVVFISASFAFADNVIQYGEQKNYSDKIVYQDQTPYQKIVITQWKNDFWLYLNQNLQFSTLDEPLYHEVLVHPVMQLHPHPTHVAVLGGGDGCAVRELLKYESIQDVRLVDLDPAMIELAMRHDVLVRQNDSSFYSSKVHVTNDDAYHFMDTSRALYDVIILDLPDPRTVELSRMYSYEFYSICKRQLRPGGVLITQAGSPYFAPTSYKCIQNTLDKAGFSTLPIHNNILTMGEWGWVIATADSTTKEVMLDRMENGSWEELELQFMNEEAVNLITSFGQNYFEQKVDSIKANHVHDPVLYHYYLNGRWDTY